MKTFRDSPSDLAVRLLVLGVMPRPREFTAARAGFLLSRVNITSNFSDMKVVTNFIFEPSTVKSNQFMIFNLNSEYSDRLISNFPAQEKLPHLPVISGGARTGKADGCGDRRPRLPRLHRRVGLVDVCQEVRRIVPPAGIPG